MGVFDHFPYTNIHELNLSWILKVMRELDSNVEQLDEWKKTHEEEYKELKKLYDDLMNGNFTPEFYQTLNNWVVFNSTSIIGSLIKTVFFYLDDNGYFIADIPDSWSELIFGTTGLDTFPIGYDYGHLTINY